MTAVAVGGSGVDEGRGVWVGGRVAVKKTTGDGVGVSGVVTSALQAVLTNSTDIRMRYTIGSREFCFTALLYPRIGLRLENSLTDQNLKICDNILKPIEIGL